MIGRPPRRLAIAILLAALGYGAEWAVLSMQGDARTALRVAFLCQLAWNGLALAAYLDRARRGGAEARGFGVGAAAFLVLGLANALGVAALAGAGAAVAGSVALLALGAVLQGAGILLWPWRRAHVHRAASALGAAVFTSSVIVLFWGVGSWTADRGREPFFSTMQLGLALRQLVLSSVAVYLLLESPRRWRGMLGWISVGAVGSGLVLTSFQAFLGTGTLVSSGVSAAVGLVPLLMAAGAWSGAPAEVCPEAVPADRRWLLLVFVPFLVSGATLAAAHLARPDSLSAPTLGFLVVTAGVVAVAGLLVRELEAGQRQLEARVDDRTRDLEGAMVQLVRHQRLGVVATLAAGAVHDLKNLLAVIRSHAAVLREQLDGAAPAMRDSAADLDEASQRAAVVAGHLLDHLREEPEPAAPLDLAATLREEARLLRAVVPRTISLTLDVPPDAAPARVSRHRLLQIVLNLLANAADAVGGHGRIAVGLERAGGAWVLGVEDDGPGFPPEIIAHLFEPLRTTRAGRGGVGLGLVSVKALAERDGGVVAIRSAPGRGARVTVAYPAGGAGVSTARPAGA